MTPFYLTECKFLIKKQETISKHLKNKSSKPYSNKTIQLTVWISSNFIWTYFRTIVIEIRITFCRKFQTNLTANNVRIIMKNIKCLSHLSLANSIFLIKSNFLIPKNVKLIIQLQTVNFKHFLFIQKKIIQGQHSNVLCNLVTKKAETLDLQVK